MRIFPLLLAAAALAAPPAPASAAQGPAQPARARANLASYVTGDDYPAAAIAAGHQGTVRFRLLIGTNGRVTACEVVGSSGSAILDSTTCRILRARARFTPATDAAGKPVPDRVVSLIRWTLPGGQAPDPGIDAAAAVWLRCLKTQMAPQWQDRARPTRALAEAAFPACRAEEEKLAPLLRPEWRTDPQAAKEQFQRGLRESIIALLDEQRNPPKP
jgi:TonB family protein